VDPLEIDTGDIDPDDIDPDDIDPDDIDLDDIDLDNIDPDNIDPDDIDLDNINPEEILPLGDQNEDLREAVPKVDELELEKAWRKNRKGDSEQLEKAEKVQLYIPSARGGVGTIVHSDYIWYIKNNYTKYTALQCSRCKSSAKLWRIPKEHPLFAKNGWITEMSPVHSHEPNLAQIDILKFKSEIRENGQKNLERQARTFASEAVDKVGCNMDLGPSEASMAAMVRRARIEAEKWMANTRSFTLPPPFQKNAAGELWVLADTGEQDPERIVVVSSPVCQNALETATDLFIDGTFDACPDSFYQLMTIHGIVAEIKVNGRHQSNTVSLPLCFALLPRKSGECYSRLLQLLKERIAMDPKTFLMDFEQGLASAIREAFPGTEIHFCFFHFGQSLWRHVGQIYGGVQLYKVEKSSFRCLVRGFTSLAFVPPERVIEGFNEIASKNLDRAQNKIEKEACLKFTSYFQKTYIGELDPIGRRKKPLYPIEDWNVYHRTRANMPRTNNAVEGWHSGMTKLVAKKNPSLLKFYTKLQEEDTRIRNRFREIKSGQFIPKKRSVPSANHAFQIRRTVLRFAEFRSLSEYIETISFYLLLG